MATSKSGAKASPAKKTTAKKTTKPSTAKAKPAAVKTKTVVRSANAPTLRQSFFKTSAGEPNYPAIIIAEVIGTFTLTLVTLLTLQETASLYIALTVAAIVLAIGTVSGAQINPAVTFGLWATRKLKSILVPVYWLAQFVGAILAILVLGLFSGTSYALDFSHFTNMSWGIFGVEALGAAIFLFGFMAVLSHDKLSQGSKAFGIGLSLMVGILVSTTALTTLQESEYSAYSNQQQAAVESENEPEIPAELRVKGATLNPAIALAATERTDSQLSGYGANAEEVKYSRLTLEVIFGTLVGAALGANLYLLVAYAHRQSA